MEVFRVAFEGADGWTVDAFVGFLGDRFEVVGVSIRSFEYEDAEAIDAFKSDGLRRLRSSDVRRQPLGSILSYAPRVVGAEMFRQLATLVEATADIEDLDLEEKVLDYLQEVGDAAVAIVQPPRAGRPPLYDLDHFRSVAETYRDAEAAGLPPTRTVAEQMQTSRTAAAKWVARCRELGLLGPAPSRGRRGEAVTLDTIDTRDPT